MYGKSWQSAANWWDGLYSAVLNHGEWADVRGKRMLESNDVQYTTWQHQHLDPRVGRNVNLDYVRREFAWFMMADRFDTRMTKYAKLWEACVQWDGGINSNYGQYLFNHEDEFDAPFYCALDRLYEDPSTRRCWVPIFQSYHQQPALHQDYPCTTGLGFRTNKAGELEMTVHMRSQDLWWGAANDQPICYMIQLLAQAYLRWNGLSIELGPIVHKIDNLHFYDRHVIKARDCIGSAARMEVLDAIGILGSGFNHTDLVLTARNGVPTTLSPAMEWVLSIDGDYGKYDQKRV